MRRRLQIFGQAPTQIRTFCDVCGGTLVFFQFPTRSYQVVSSFTNICLLLLFRNFGGDAFPSITTYFDLFCCDFRMECWYWNSIYLCYFRIKIHTRGIFSISLLLSKKNRNHSFLVDLVLSFTNFRSW